MSEHRSWDSFDFRDADGVYLADRGHPSDEDGILLDIEPGAVDAGHVEVGLMTAAHVTWWKAVRVVNQHGQDVGHVATQDDDHGGRYLRLPVAMLPGASLDLEKAKMFGAHTGMYRLRFDEMPVGPGTRFTFHWHRDS